MLKIQKQEILIKDYKCEIKTENKKKTKSKSRELHVIINIYTFIKTLKCFLEPSARKAYTFRRCEQKIIKNYVGTAGYVEVVHIKYVVYGKVYINLSPNRVFLIFYNSASSEEVI
jgi:hypothetical protein